MKHKYVITVIRQDTLLYVFGPYTSKKAAKADLAEKTRQEAYENDEWEVIPLDSPTTISHCPHTTTEQIPLGIGGNCPTITVCCS